MTKLERQAGDGFGPIPRAFFTMSISGEVSLQCTIDI
jgi:hypothetical protein